MYLNPLPLIERPIRCGPYCFAALLLTLPAPATPTLPVIDPAAAPANLDPARLGFEEIVFVKRKPYSSDHYYTDIDNGTSPDRFVPENGIFVYHLRTKRERPVITAAELPGGTGFIDKISLSFDAKKLLFDFRQDPRSGFRIWEVGIDGSGLRQVLKAPPDEAEKVARWGKPFHTDDIHPCYLPDGGIRVVRRFGPPLCSGPAPHECRRQRRRADHPQPGQRVLPGDPRRRPRDVPPLGVYRQRGAGRQDDLVTQPGRHPPAGTLRSGRRLDHRLHVSPTIARR
jgi:hypothetical protein